MDRWWTGSLGSNAGRFLPATERRSAGKRGRGDLADEDGHGHFLAAIDGKADFVFAGMGDLEGGNAHDDGRAGRGSTGQDLDGNLLGLRRRLEFLAVGIDDGNLYFFEAFFDFLETDLGNKVTTDGHGKLGDDDHIGGAEDIEFALEPGPRGKTKSQNFGRHAGRVNQKRKGKKEKLSLYGLLWRLTSVRGGSIWAHHHEPGNIQDDLTALEDRALGNGVGRRDDGDGRGWFRAFDLWVYVPGGTVDIVRAQRLEPAHQ